MRLIPVVLGASRLFAAMILLAGLSGAVRAESAKTASVLNIKESAAVKPAAGKTAQNAQALTAAARLDIPLYFEANRGQTDASVRFFTRAPGYNLYLTASEAVMVLPKAATAKNRTPGVVRMKLKGANASPAIRGRDILPGRTSYLFGKDSAKWQVGVEQYSRVEFGQVYPGIDMVYYFNQGHVEYDFIVAPGANPGRILIGFEGATGLRLDSRGNLVLGVEGGELTYQAPKLYQTLNGKRTAVKGRFVLASNKNVMFEIGDYIRNKELVIDPKLVYSTYLGAQVDEKITGIAVDGTQQAYVTGWSRSAQSGTPGGFPAATKTLPAVALVGTIGGSDVFVAKFSADGTALMWLAWLGGTLDDVAYGIALDSTSVSTPGVYITGETKSAGAGTSFPVAGPALQTCDTNTGSLAFVAKLEQTATPDTPTLEYSTCWGGVSGILTNRATAIAVDSRNAAYVTGTTFAANFPVTPGIAFPYNGSGTSSESGFVFKVAPGGSSVEYSMYLGPQSGITNSNAIAVDSAFQAWVAGATTSDTWPAAAILGNFSTTRTAGVWSDAFVAQVKADGTALDYATYINGNVREVATAIALNNGGRAPYHVFVAGYTDSGTDFPSTAYYNFYTTGDREAVYQKDLTGADDPFILRLNPFLVNTAPLLPNPQEMVYATHLGATGADQAYALALDDRDDAYIAGWTRSSDWGTPADGIDTTTPPAVINVEGAVMSNTSTDQAAFVAAIGPSGLFQPFFTYLGASPGTFGLQTANGIVIDADHNIYVAGITPSNLWPLVTGSLMDASVATKQINRTGTENATDGFVTKIAPVLSFGGPLPATCTITGISPIVGFTTGGTTVTITGTNLNGLVLPGAVTFGGVNASSYTVTVTSTVITAVTPRHPLTGPLTVGPVSVSVVTPVNGTCSWSPYTYVLAPVAEAGCGEDYFFPSPATGANGYFAYCMALPGTAKIKVYNAVGDLVAKIEDVKPAGAQISPLNTARLASGVYLYRLEKDYGGGNSTASKVKKFVVRH